MENLTGLTLTLREVAGRIRELRLIEGLSPAQMAQKTGVTAAEYLQCESGEADLNFAFLYRCAIAFGVDVTDLIQGSSPTLTSYALTRAGSGQKIEKAHGMTYFNMAAAYKNRIAEPLYVLAEYSEEAQRQEIPLTTHEGQECDIVVSGRLKVQVGTHCEVLGPGDTIYYDSDTPHGMIAVDGADCAFYAIVLNPTEYAAHAGTAVVTSGAQPPRKDTHRRVWERFITPEENEDGSLRSIAYRDTKKFNFAFDVVDAIAAKEPDKLALLHVAQDGAEKRITFNDVRHESNRAANYLRTLGVQKGDRVMLILRRHYQFWYIINALHKLGAIAVLAPDQLLEKDLRYRFEAAGISAVICTGFGGVAAEVEKAALACPDVRLRIMVNGERAD